MIIPSIIRAAVVKKTKSTHLGISLMMQNGELVVSQISQDSPFKNTELRVGYEILSINREHFTDADKAVSYLKHVDGLVDMLTSSHPFPGGGDLTFVKNHPNELINSIQFSRLNQSLVRVDHIHPQGPFASTNLAVGDVVLTINNKAVANPIVASRLLLSNDESQVWILSLSKRKFLEAAIKSMVLKQDKSKPWTKPKWLPPNKIEIGRKDWDQPVVLRFETGGICVIDEPWLFLDESVFKSSDFAVEAEYSAKKRDERISLEESSNLTFKVRYSDWYRHVVLPRVEEINEYLKKNIANIEVAVQRSPYREIYPDEALVASLAKLAHQHKHKQLTNEEYTAAKFKVLGIRIAKHTPTSC